MATGKNLDIEAKIRQAFESFDKNQDGKISFNELVEQLKIDKYGTKLPMSVIKGTKIFPLSW